MTLTAALRRHWREYLIEATLLALFMISASLFATLLESGSSPVRSALPDPFVRRALMGLAMGTTAILLIYSPWGGRSGAHFNPATTFTFWRLGRVAPADAAWYPAAHFVGGVAGMVFAQLVLRLPLTDPGVNYVITLPMAGVLPAFAAEVIISFGLMFTVLVISNRPSTARWTGVAAGLLVGLYITFEGPVSGMSMNPARTFGSAAAAGNWTALWLYFTAPVLGMLAAAEAYLLVLGKSRLFCAKLNHPTDQPCLFCEHHSRQG